MHEGKYIAGDFNLASSIIVTSNTKADGEDRRQLGSSKLVVSAACQLDRPLSGLALAAGALNASHAPIHLKLHQSTRHNRSTSR